MLKFIVDNNIVTLIRQDGSNWRGCYENSARGREIIKRFFDNGEEIVKTVMVPNPDKGEDRPEEIESTVPVTWDDILEIWGDTPTVIFPEVPFKQLVEDKQQQIKHWCEDKIISGIDIDLGLKDDHDSPLGSLHYSLTERHQMDMRDLASIIQAGATSVTWRDDSRVSHMVYTAEQFMKLYQAATAYIFNCRFRSDGLEELLFSYTENDRNKVKALTWDTELPKEIQDKINSLLGTMNISE